MRIYIYMKIKPWLNGEITLSFTDIGKFCHCHKFLKSQICLLTLFAKIKFSQIFPNLQYKERTKASWMDTDVKRGLSNYSSIFLVST